jgi:transcriptional accessory protein Tex/SPT6
VRVVEVDLARKRIALTARKGPVEKREASSTARGGSPSVSQRGPNAHKNEKPKQAATFTNNPFANLRKS